MNVFKSQLSGKVYGPGVSPQMVVVARRPQTYVNYVGEDDEEKITHGWEIVKELRIGPDELL
jgi:hypothetical protein